jgi:hypothetical protein
MHVTQTKKISINPPSTSSVIGGDPSLTTVTAPVASARGKTM